MLCGEFNAVVLVTDVTMLFAEYSYEVVESDEEQGYESGQPESAVRLVPYFFVLLFRSLRTLCWILSGLLPSVYNLFPSAVCTVLTYTSSSDSVPCA